MTEDQELTLLQLTAANVALLAEMRDMMRAFLTAATEQPGEVFATCQHPEESRVEFSTPSDRGHWVCGVCRYDNKAVA